jgi:hypothetical protein
MFSQIATASSEGNNLRGQRRSINARNDDEFQRRLAESAAERFAYWTPEKIKRATPLDLKLDAISGEAYLSGMGGDLKSYERSADRIEDEEEPNTTYWDSVVQLGDLMEGGSMNSATQFVKGHTRRDLKIIPKEQMDTSKMVSLLDDGTHVEYDITLKPTDADRMLNRQRKGKPQPKGTTTDEKEKSNQKKQWMRKSPKLRQLRPSRGSVVKDQTTFRAKVLPADDEIVAVYIQLTDFEGETSDYISLHPVSSKPNEKMFEVSLGGFVEEYSGTEWSYKVIVQESSGVQYSFVDIPFTVATAKTIQSAPPTATPQIISEYAMDKTTVLDAEWPHGGAIQSSTGRILFDFGGETHVCSGTVVNDGGIYNERSLILTAAHCAYDVSWKWNHYKILLSTCIQLLTKHFSVIQQDLSKQFASNAIFIPDQAGSLAPTDFDCSNDRYGCWYLSFAVIEKGWADSSFPENAQYDYAFYVVHDFVGTHIDGYSEVTGVLDQDIIPATLDFAADPKSQFFVSFGYSEDYDPSFRYCSGDGKSIREVPNYTNLWLPECNLQGGASGGPWLVDIDSSGVGTVMSLNSWGFTDGPGMAGPSLQTSSGSKAQCLFNVAQTAQDPGSTRGYAIAC